MKVTSFKDVETYIYSSVILPLKELNVPALPFPTPIRGDKNEQWMFSVGLAPTTGRYRRNYQRTQAERTADMQVRLVVGDRAFVVASYNRRNKWVKVYQRPFVRLKAVPLYGKLFEAFQRNTPFIKVIPEMDAPRERFVRRGYEDGPVPAVGGSFFDPEQSEEGDDDL